MSMSSRGPLVAWQGDQFSAHSLATVNRALCRRLLQAGLDVVLEAPDAPPSAARVPPELAGLHRAVGPGSGAPDVTVRHSWPPRFERPRTGRWAQIQPWEFGGIPRAWVEGLRADEIWVPSTWVRSCYLASGVAADRVHVVPNGVDAEHFRPDGPALGCGRGRALRLLFVGGLLYRKGIDLLVDAYLQAFTPQDDVCLVVKGFGSAGIYRSSARAQLQELAAREDVPAIEILDEELDDAAMAALYRSCHVLVHPYRGEGFALPVIEAVASGLPVITTGYGPVLDYLEPGAATFLPVALRAAPAVEQEFGPPAALGYFLAEPDRDALVAALRQAGDGLPADDQVAKARCRVVEEFSWDRAAASAERRVRELAASSPPVQWPATVQLFHAVSADRDDWKQLVSAYVTAFDGSAPVVLRLACPGGPEDVPAVAGILESVITSAGRDPASCASIELAPAAAGELDALADAADIVFGGDPARSAAGGRLPAGASPLRLREAVDAVRAAAASSVVQAGDTVLVDPSLRPGQPNGEAKVTPARGEATRRAAEGPAAGRPGRVSSSGRLWFVCGEEEHPGGGMRTAYRHVQVLNDAGVPAAIVHPRRGYRCTDLPEEVPVVAYEDVRADPEHDLLVFPEVVGPDFANAVPGCARAVFNQNPFLTFSRWPWEGTAAGAYQSRDVVGVVTVSAHAARYLRWAFPYLAIRQVVNAVDTDRFAPAERKRPILAVTPRKGLPDIGQVLNLLAGRGHLGAWTVVPLHQLPRQAVADALAEAAIFLATGWHEGAPLALLEAMAAECLVVGYDGFGGAEFLDGDVGRVVPCGDVLSLAQAVEWAMVAFERGDFDLRRRTTAARRRVVERCASGEEQRSIVDAWSDMLTRAADRQGAVTPPADPVPRRSPAG